MKMNFMIRGGGFLRVDKILKRIEGEILAAGGKRSRSRSVVMEMFFRARNHLTVEELTRAVHVASPRIGSVTVYRTLKLLARMGYANELDFGEGVRRYESSLSSHHDHLVCTTCGEVIEFEDPEIERLQDQVTRRHGFRPSAHRLEIFGLCRKCSPAGAGKRDG
jgi:Fur family transcriptional regulator, ferric uptake regulator